MNQRRSLAAILPALLLVLTVVPCAAQIQIFSTGQYGTPETISLAPAGFGPFGGSYFIPDARTGNIWIVPATGGPPAEFLAAPIEPVGNSIIGGLFLPSGWDANSGKFLVASQAMLVVGSDGTITPFDALGGAFTMPLIAPAFGSYVGNLFVTDQNGVIWRAAPPDGGLTVFADLRGGPFVGGPFGIELTPPGFGSFGDRLLVNDTLGGSIIAIAADGTWGPFTTIPVAAGQSGLRQMLMAPDDYFLESLGIPGPLLLLSVSGSNYGGGTLGEVLALDSVGNVVGHLKVGSVLAKFDPRGMVFTADGHLLISDTSDPIYAATAADFAPGREDTCSPSVSSSIATATLWPVNHELVRVGLTATAADTCPGSPTVGVTVFSEEGDLAAGGGSGNFSPDAANIALDVLRLRSERKGNGDGRVYLVVVRATDTLGFAAFYCSTVVVPKSQKASDVDAVEAQAGAARTFCLSHAGGPPPGYVPVGVGPVVGPKQ